MLAGEEWREFAPAKVNLFLHVGPPAADGFHPLCSLMVFADVGDRLVLSVADAMEIEIRGPFGAGLSAGPDNLIVRARDALIARASGAMRPFRIELDKQLPIASGLGGGSADAAATLRLVRRAIAPDAFDAELLAIARDLGSDVPACLLSQSAIGTGRGDVLSPATSVPLLNVVLVNALVASPTSEVYRAYDAAPAAADRPETPPVFESASACVRWLRGLRNDLEAPATRLRPLIGEVLRALSAQPECLLARMSGSGATCFALTSGATEAAALATRLSAAWPKWWIRPATLGGPAPS